MQTQRKTKIIATLGPACNNKDILATMLKAGLNCARFNFSHGNHTEHLNRLKLLQEAEKETGIHAVYMLDTKGPEVRTGPLAGDPIMLEKGKSVFVSGKVKETSADCIAISYPRIHAELRKGDLIKIADGSIQLLTQEILDGKVRADIISGGLLGNRKNVNIPDLQLQLPSMSSKDTEDIQFAIEHDFDYLAASFIRSAEDVLRIREILNEKDSDIHIISKIENQEGLDNLQSILQVSDGIMVARGDLAEQVAPETVPLIQKRIILQCNEQRKIVITATQMLQSMEQSETPTRAELTDVANAIFDGSDAIMLSGETAQGLYPVEAIAVMHKVSLAVEKSRLFKDHVFTSFSHTRPNSLYSGDSASETMVSAAQMVANKSNASMFASPTNSGYTPKKLACLRPEQPILSPTKSQRVYKKLLLLWGVTPILLDSTEKNNAIEDTIEQIRRRKFLGKNQKIVLVGAFPRNVPLQVNIVQVHFEGKILFRTRFGCGPVAQGILFHAQTINQIVQHEEETRNKNEKFIYYTNKLTFEMLAILPKLSGIIVKQPIEIPMKIIANQCPNTAILSHIDNLMFTKLEEGKEIVISGKEQYAYEP